MGKEKQDRILVSVNKKNPKPDAPCYEIRTIKEMFDILTEDNYKKFLRELKKTIELRFAIMEILNHSVGKHDETKENLETDTFIWIDD